VGQRVANAGEALLTEARNRLEPSVVRGRLQIGQRLQPEFFMQAIGQPEANARHRREKPDRICFAAQPIEHRQASMDDELTNRARDAITDAAQRL
jgi:hypothetical protein